MTTNAAVDLNTAMTLRMSFGKHNRKMLKDIHSDYLQWLTNQDNIHETLRDAANAVLNSRMNAVKRLAGGTSHSTTYVIERLGDISGLTEHDTLDDALNQLSCEYPLENGGERTTPDPEDDRILIWEVLASGHKKVVWHFSGWHWDAEEFDLDQGILPGDTHCLYAIARD